jgi:hypothetical protein
MTRFQKGHEYEVIFKDGYTVRGRYDGHSDRRGGAGRRRFWLTDLDPASGCVAFAVVDDEARLRSVTDTTK